LDKRTRLVCEWMEKARRDLRLAELALREEIHDGAAFHSQQAAEKALKALILALGGKIRKTHDIGELLDTLESLGLETREFYSIDADILTDYAVEARYPGPPVAGEEAMEAYHIAARVLQLVDRELERRGITCGKTRRSGR